GVLRRAGADGGGRAAQAAGADPARVRRRGGRRAPHPHRRAGAGGARVTRAVLSLGSNLGDRFAYLRSAVAGFGDAVRAVSPVYETAPWGGVEQDDFLNAVLVVEDPAVDEWGWLRRGQGAPRPPGAAAPAPGHPGARHGAAALARRRPGRGAARPRTGRRAAGRARPGRRGRDAPPRRPRPDGGAVTPTRPRDLFGVA